MNRAFPIFTILPGRTKVSDAVRQAQSAGAGLWLTDRGQVIVSPMGLPGWTRLPIRTADTLPCTVRA